MANGKNVPRGRCPRTPSRRGSCPIECEAAGRSQRQLAETRGRGLPLHLAARDGIQALKVPVLSPVLFDVERFELLNQSISSADQHEREYRLNGSAVSAQPGLVLSGAGGILSGWVGAVRSRTQYRCGSGALGRR